MKGYLTNIEQATLENTDYRRVLYMAKHCQLYTVYAPPEHKDGIVHVTKADEREERLDGKTTEA